MTWQEICDDPALQDLPYKIETDRWGRLMMSPARSDHGEYQAEISGILREQLPHGRVITECPIQTMEGVRVPDVAWISRERRANMVRSPAYSRSPEICVEVISPSNFQEEMDEKRRLYFEMGAQEVWYCEDHGGMSFYDRNGPIEKSVLCPAFPSKIEV
jgi:Uma2 family endonuclease